MMLASEAKQVADDFNDHAFMYEVERVENWIRSRAEKGGYRIEVTNLKLMAETLELLSERGYVIRTMGNQVNGKLRYEISWGKGGREE